MCLHARVVKVTLAGIALAAAVAGCGTSPWGSRPPTPAMAHAQELSDGIATLSSIEAQLAAAAANEPRRLGAQADGSNYFTALAKLAAHGRERAGQLGQATADRVDEAGSPQPAGVVTVLHDLASHFAALEGACRHRDIAAVRQARQAIAAAMVALHTQTPRLSGG